jgi:glycosyltransferase involved in cell wall biosynthesis
MITVGIICKNEEANIGETISRLRAQDYPVDQFEVIVIDGNSTDKTREIASRVLSKCKFSYKILNEVKLGGKGHAFARNQVVKLSSPKSQYIAFTDGDCAVPDDWLTKLYAAVWSGDPKKVAGIGGSRTVHPDDREWGQAVGYYLASGVGTGGKSAFAGYAGEVVSIANCNAIYPKEVLVANPYDEKLGHSDDLELNFRLKQKGFVFYNFPEIQVKHHAENSFKSFWNQMFLYGKGQAAVYKIYKKLPRWYAIVPPLFLIGLVSGLALSFIWPILITPYLCCITLYLMFMLGSGMLNAIKFKSLFALSAAYLIPIHWVAYGCGFISEMLS